MEIKKTEDFNRELEFFSKGQGVLQKPVGEQRIAFLFLIILLFLRIVFIFRYPFNSDEPQHLHVVWGWAHGLLPYRDVFDNHAPLFHLLWAPIFATLGDHPETLFWMRLTMIPLYLLALGSTYEMGQRIFSLRVGLWAAVFTGLFPRFFLCSTEFRTDNLWTVLWLVTMVLLVRGPITFLRSFTVGILLGATMAVSMKTTLLLVTLSIAGLTTLYLSAGYQPVNLSDLFGCVMRALVGFSLIPGALILFFFARGALEPFFYGVIKHNILPGLGSWGKFRWYRLLFPIGYPFLWWGAQVMIRRIPDPVGIRRAFVFLVTGVYLSALYSFWPLIERQHFLPFYPLCLIFLTYFVLDRAGRWFKGWSVSFLRYLVPTGIALLEIVSLVVTEKPWQDRTRDQIELLKDVLTLTQPGDPVMDVKGEMIFRPRAFYYVLETITMERLKRGLIKDDIPERLMETHTYVAALDNSRFPPRAGKFLRENYLPIGRLRVVGQFLAPSLSDGKYVFSFEVRIPAPYVIISEKGILTGWMDGTPCQGARFLTVGHHEFFTSPTEGRFALIWAQAVERGFSPFKG
ncbi:MAG TPA: hypothetical protein VNM22_08875 [Candidatus Limnocylindrales bacterium]|nr:hypothetical protein [Candidatus Limnocylindrales bacterium]